MTPQRRKFARGGSPLPSITLIGCGNWGTALALALRDAGIPLGEIVVRKSRAAHSRMAASLGTHLTTLSKATLDADIFWICTPDAAIAGTAASLAKEFARTGRLRQPIVFHSSGALTSAELAPLRAIGASLASVPPLMTFPSRAKFPSRPQLKMQPPLAGVSFAIEGDLRAMAAARRILRALRAESFVLDPRSKPLYHAFGVFSSPLLVALLTAATETAVAAGFKPEEARRHMRPIIERTIANFFTDGPQKSFSGPIARGDVATIARHLHALRSHPRLQPIYGELTRFALDSLPAQEKNEIRKLLPARSSKSSGKSASPSYRRASTA